MRTYWMAVLCLIVAGCDNPTSPPVSYRCEKVDATPTRLAETQRQFAAFLDEVGQAIRLLESHPQLAQLIPQSKALHELLAQTTDVYPSHKTVAALTIDGRIMLRYFDAAVNVAQFQAHQPGIDHSTAQRHIDNTCKGNLPLMRDLLKKMRAELAQPKP